jgi:septum formation protein
MMPTLVLASASPRRAALLAAAGYAFSVDAAAIDEDAAHAGVRSPARRAMLLAGDKACAVAERHPGAVVVAADTIVVLDDAPLGKPRDEAEAIAMLSRLSGRSHEVVTGIAVAVPEAAIEVGFAATQVAFARWPAAALLAYARSGAPLDKAGAYGIQEAAGRFVDGVVGDPTNVVGLPMSRLARLLAAAGVRPGG